jgi:hypothetical protein
METPYEDVDWNLVALEYGPVLIVCEHKMYLQLPRKAMNFLST